MLCDRCELKERDKIDTLEQGGDERHKEEGERQRQDVTRLQDKRMEKERKVMVVSYLQQKHIL